MLGVPILGVPVGGHTDSHWDGDSLCMGKSDTLFFWGAMPVGWGAMTLLGGIMPTSEGVTLFRKRRCHFGGVQPHLSRGYDACLGGEVRAEPGG